MTAAVPATTEAVAATTAAGPVLAATGESLVDVLVLRLSHLLGMGIFAGIVAFLAAFGYRWYVRDPIPRGLAVLLGLSAVAALLSTTEILGQIIDNTGDDTQLLAALFNISAFAAGLLGANAGRRVGDNFGTDVFEATSFGGVEEDVGRLVTALGRVITVQLPDDIDDVVGYDPVPEATKAELAGRSFIFPRRLTVAELRDRLVARLKTDYAVGHVDVELTADGTVEYLGVGSRAAGIGPTLPPSTNAMAIRADPAFAASAGDLVQVWEPSPAKRVLTAELRGVAGDVVTVAIDAADTPKLDPTTEYRLVTLPVEDRPDREFVSMLRAADETFASVTVEAGSAIDGATVGSLSVATIAVSPDGGEPEVLPTADRTVAAGEVVHAIARPEALRRLEADSEAGSGVGVGSEVAADAEVASTAETEAQNSGADVGSDDVDAGPEGAARDDAGPAADDDESVDDDSEAAGDEEETTGNRSQETIAETGEEKAGDDDLPAEQSQAESTGEQVDDDGSTDEPGTEDRDGSRRDE